MADSGALVFVRWVFVGLALLALVFTVSIAYVAVAQPGCESCHLVGEYGEATIASSHASVKCMACHPGSGVLQRLSFSSNVVNSMLLGIVPSQGRPGASVEDAACLACHDLVLEQLTDSKGYRIQHLTCAADRSCVDCHSSVAHGSASTWPRSSEMSVCVECHDGATASNQCDACHSGKTESERIGQGAWRVTHGQDWRSAHGMGNFETCSACHPKDYCVRCHGIALPHDEDFMREHAVLSLTPGSLCDDCHHTSFCSDCHGIEMPHPVTFIAEHAVIVAAEGDDVCIECHKASDCANCHLLHVHPGLSDAALDSLGGVR